VFAGWGGLPQVVTLTTWKMVSLGHRKVFTGVRRAVAFEGLEPGRLKLILL
jgi:hypothetical protein